MMKNKSGFTIVELLLGILIFTLGGLSAYLLIYAAINSSIKSRNEIIASNIAREQLELVRNNRDTNWLRYLQWDKLDNTGNPGASLTGGIYTIENDFSSLDTSSNPSISLKKLSSGFSEENRDIINSTEKVRLCIDSRGRYTHECNNFTTPTRFYSYIKVEPLKTHDNTTTPITDVVVDNAYKITSIVVNSERNFSRFVVPTIITDWKK